MIKYCISIVVCLIAAFLPSNEKENANFEMAEMYLTDVEEQLGKDFSSKKPDLSLPGVSVKSGESLIKYGFIPKDLGRKARKQSKHFVCTSCHNIEREDPNLAMPDPQARLDYAESKGLPFLQGSPLYGVINRNTYYNGDYQVKYGDFALRAKSNIREAIQLCAQECAQGRKLANWEVESILAYFWTIGVKMKDLKISEVENSAIRQAISNKETMMKTKAIELLSLKYMDKSDATFIPPPENRKTGSGLVGNAINGEKIYKLSCLHCHQNQRYSFLDLDESAISLNYLKRHLPTYHRQSIYQVTRWGVPVFSGKKSYMPQYPVERLSEQQLADLVAYVKQ